MPGPDYDKIYFLHGLEGESSREIGIFSHFDL